MQVITFSCMGIHLDSYSKSSLCWVPTRHWTWYSCKYETVFNLNMGHISPPSSPPPWFVLPTSFAQVIASDTVIPTGLPSFPFLPIVKSQLSTGTPWNPSQHTSSPSLTLPMAAHCGRQQTWPQVFQLDPQQEVDSIFSPLNIGWLCDFLWSVGCGGWD